MVKQKSSQELELVSAQLQLEWATKALRLVLGAFGSTPVNALTREQREALLRADEVLNP